MGSLPNSPQLAFEACRNAQLIFQLETSTDKWMELLQEPLMVNGKWQKYRYPNQKGRFIAGAMTHLQQNL